MSKALPLAVAGAALIAGFILFTALGVGGGSDHKTRAAAPPKPKLTKHQSAIAHYSELVSIREAQTSNRLSEDPPIAPRRFNAPIGAYRAYAARQARQLNGEVARLRAAIVSGSRARAQAAWRTAFARYLRLGAVYGAFGELDTEIDGQPGGLAGGAHDPHFTGLHRIESILWGDAPVRSAAPFAARLVRDVRRLRTAIPDSEIEPLDYATRAHEILEDAQRDFLSGVDVPWSHEGVLATASGVIATREVIATLRGLLGGRDALQPVQLGLSRLSATLRVIRRDHRGALPTLDQLTVAERERLDGSLSWLLERLQMVPGELETQDSPVIPRLRTR
jgi:iron uptake system EfeUOB component EfeO/EfeM